jgi:hypothetical protein
MAQIAKKKTQPSSSKPGIGTLTLQGRKGVSTERIKAESALYPEAGNAITAINYSAGYFGPSSLDESIAVIKSNVAEVRAGDLAYVESTLVSQATALNAIFVELARRAALNMGEHLHAMEAYMRLALKAQTQCRSTLETLAEIKNPRSAVAFVKQANITSGPQQVNNGVSGPVRADARAGEISNQSNELLQGVINGERVDTRTQETAGGSNQGLETVEQINRAENP